MRKIIPLLILICCFSTSMYAFESMTSTTFNADLSIENTKKATTDIRPKFRIGFDAPQINHRQLLLTIDENCTDGVDWGYDGASPQVLPDDMYWLINNNEYVIQGTGSVFVGKEIPLGVVTTNGGAITIKIDAIENPITGLKVGLKDTALNVIHKLEESNYQVTLDAGVYHTRFVIVFLSANDTELPTSEDTTVEVTEPTEDEVSELPPPPPPGSTDTEATAGEEEVNEDAIGTEEGNESEAEETGTTDADTSNEESTEEETANEDANNEEATSGSEEAENEETTDTDAESTETEEDEAEESETDDNEETSSTNGQNIFNFNTGQGQGVQNYFNKNKLVIYVNNGQRTLNVKNKRGLKIKRIILLNRNGQKVQVWYDNLENENLQLQLQANSGVYIVMVQTDDARIIKRILIQNR